MAADDIGERGQWLFCLLMTQICPGRTEPYFRVAPLGDKYPTFDYLGELIGTEPYFFLVQVKATRRGFRGTRRLRVNLDRADVSRMATSPMPVYVVGIDEPRKAGYVLSAPASPTAGLGSFPARHRLNCRNLLLLWQEIHDFWARRPQAPAVSRFV